MGMGFTKSLMFLLVLCGGAYGFFKLKYEWKQIEYKFRNEEERSKAIANGTFNVGKLQPIDVQYTYVSITGSERIFITTARSAPTGYPATIGTVTKERRDGNPVIDPYPSWSWQIDPEKCNYHRIVSVYRVWADECDRLWVVDNGVVGSSFVCPPQLLAFDLKTDKLLDKYEIPYEQYQNKSVFATPTAEVEDQACENTWLYVADTDGPSLLVYSLKQNTSWRIEDKSFEANPKYNNYSIGGNTFQVADGIITVALSPKTDSPKDRKLHYHGMSDINESWVYTKHLKNATNFKVPYGSAHLFNTYPNSRNQQSAVEASDSKGILYFSLLIDVKLVKWDPELPYTKANFKVIGSDYKTMQFPSGLKIDTYKGGKDEVLWVFATAYQRSASKTLNGNETNFRIFMAKLELE